MPDQGKDSLIKKGVRQGSVFPCSAMTESLLNALKDNRAIIEARSRACRPDDKLIVLSQDCDINSDSEHYIEVVLAQKPRARDLKNNEQLKGARNTRKLHLLHAFEYRECHVQNISMLPKALLLKDADFSAMEMLSDQARETLLVWRINRYTRTPLPHDFNVAFMSDYLRRPDVNLRELLEGLRDTINDLYVFVDPMEEGAEIYRVSMTVLVYQHCTDDTFDQIADNMLEHLTALHERDNCLRMMQVDPAWVPENIAHTLDIIARPDSFSMQDLMAMSRLSLDYLCFPDE